MLPVGSTALDFAFAIHSAIGVKTIGAKVNHKLVPISHKLRSGDQVEIITSNKQKPSEDWLGFVVTAKAKGRIKDALKEEKRKLPMKENIQCSENWKEWVLHLTSIILMNWCIAINCNSAS